MASSLENPIDRENPELLKQMKFDENEKRAQFYYIKGSPLFVKLTGFLKEIENKDMYSSGANITDYLKLLESDDIIDKHKGIISIRKCVAQPNLLPNITEMLLQGGFLDHIKDFILNENFPVFEVEALWCVSNLASGSSEDIEYLISVNILPILRQKLRRGIYEIVENALWAIGNITGDSKKNRDLVIEAGCIEEIGDLFLRVKDKCPKLASHIIWTIHNVSTHIAEGEVIDLNLSKRIVKVAMLALGLRCIDKGERNNCYDIIRKNICEQTLDFYTTNFILPMTLQALHITLDFEVKLRCIRIIGQYTILNDEACQVGGD